MNIYEIIIIGFCLGMDAFSVSIGKSISFKNNYINKSLIVSLYFGFFQFFMTIIGFYLGSSFSSFISNLDHWIAFGLLISIGVQMILDTKRNDVYSNNTNFYEMLVLSIATSIDALTVGVTFSFFKIPILFYSIIIGIITFVLCFFGCFIGRFIGDKFCYISNYLGGLLLILIAFKILFEHTLFLNYIMIL